MTITIADGSSKNVSIGDKLILKPDYLPPTNESDLLIYSLNNSKVQMQILDQGGNSIVVDIEPSEILEVWRKQ